MAKKENEIVVDENVAADTPAQEVPAEDQTLPEGEVVQDPAPVAEAFVAAYVEPPEYQAKALEEQGAFDYHIQGAEAVLKSPYTEGSAEHFHYSKGWNDAFNADNKG